MILARTMTMLCAVALCLLLSGPVSAATITVGPSGDHTTIQAAIDAALAGDTIVIDDGVYNENVNVNKAVTLVSVNGSGATTIQGSAAQATATGGGNAGTLCLSVDGIAIGTSTADGLTVVGYDWTSPGIEHAAIYIKGTLHGDLSIIGNSLVADGEAALLAEYGCITGGNVEIAFNEFSGQTYVGTTIGGDSSVQFTTPNVPRSMIYFGGNNIGINFHDNVVGGSVGGVIEGTTDTYYNTGATIDCKGATSLADGAVIDNNTFTIPSWASLRARGYYSTITNNVFDASVSGMYVGAYYENTENDVLANNQRTLAPGMTIKQAVDVAYPGDVVNVPAGTFVEPEQIVIANDIVIQGAGKAATIVQPGFNTGTSAYTQGAALIYVDYGVTATIQDLAIDGSGWTVAQAIQSRGDDVTVRGCDISNIAATTYYGCGVLFLTGTGLVEDSDLSAIQRIGVHFRGAIEAVAPVGTVNNCTYVGKGDGDFLDYGIEAGGGASMTVTDCTISDCRGVASSDGSVSAGIYATTFHAAGTTATITGTTVTDSHIGLRAGYTAGVDSAVMEAHENNLEGNDIGLQNVTVNTVDASHNWWGDTDPSDDVVGSVSYFPCYADASMSVLYLDADWRAFVVRGGNSTGDLPLILGNAGAVEIATFEGGQKAALATDAISSAKVSMISTLHIDRLDDVPSSGSLYGPYFNIWITDGAGNYAVIANEPSDAEWAGSRWDVSDWDFLKTKRCKVYETPGWNTNSSWVHALAGPDPLTFEDVADLTIEAPPAAYIQNPANGVGSGAPDVLGTEEAFGFNWVFGDTAANYVSGGDGFIVDGYEATANWPVNNITQGTGCATIQAAVDAADPGDEIRVSAGTYVEQVLINKDLTLIGLDSPTIVAPATVSALQMPESSKWWEAVVAVIGGAIDGSGVVTGTDVVAVDVSGFVIDGDDRAPTSGRRSAGILLRNAASTILDNVVQDMHIDGAETFGIIAYGDCDVTIEDNEVSGYARGGIGANGDLGPLPDPTAIIRNNTVTGPGLNELVTWAPNGIQIGWGATGEITGNTVTGNGWPGTEWSGSGIILAGSQNVLVQGNTISENETGIASVGDLWWGSGLLASGTTIIGNTLSNNTYGISLQDGTENTQITGNTVTRSTYDGIGITNFYGTFPTNTVITHNNIVGNNTSGDATSGGLWIADGVTTVDAEDNWWGTPAGPIHAGNATGDGDKVVGDADFDPWLGKPADLNVLYLEALPASIFIQPTESVVVHMNVANLQQKVNACQAMLGYNSTYFADPTSGPVQSGSVLPGGGVWDQVIYDSWAIGGGVPGEIDTAIGVNAQGSVGTEADGTVAIITLTSNAAVEGVTQMVFRPDLDPDPGLIGSTYLSDMVASPVWPAKVDSTNIYIDGTDPVVANLAASQGGTDVLNCAATTLQGTVNISVDASDALAGLAGEPVVTVTQGVDSLTVTSDGESPAGTFNYSIAVDATTANGTWDIDVTATDKAGNDASVSGTLCVDKNAAVCTVTMATLSNVVYEFDRDVVLTMTDGSGAVLEQRTVSMHFVNDDSAEVATASTMLTEVPGGMAGLSGKTAWSLRTKVVVALDGDGQAATTIDLIGGDVNGTNSVNILDYSLLKMNWYTYNAVADINGDGQVDTLDYSLMRDAWFQVGDDE